MPECQLWASGDAYEPYVGRWSRLVAGPFVDWLDVPAGRAWLDVGCGTGALTETIAERASPRQVVGVDPSAAFIAYARAHAPSPAEFVRQGIAEMARATVPGGLVAAYVWDYAGEMQLIRFFWDAAVELDDAATQLDEGVRFSICKPEPLLSVAREAGLVDPEVSAIEVQTVFRGFDEYWSPFLGGDAPAPAYAMSLDEQARAQLRERVRARLPIRPDGRFTWSRAPGRSGEAWTSARAMLVAAPSICLPALKVVKPPEGAELFVGLPRLAGWDNEWNDSLGRFAGRFAGASLGCRSRLELPLETLMVSAHLAPHRPSDQGL